MGVFCFMPIVDPVRNLEATMKEQLEAAWQIHVGRVEEQLRSGWQDQIEQVVSERLAELGPVVDRAVSKAVRDTSERFNQTARRLRMAESLEEWRAILLETGSAFAARAGLYFTSDDEIAKAPAFATVMETKETVVTLRASSELSAKVTDAFGESLSSKSYLFPILQSDLVVAILYAEQGESGLDRNGLELLATLASGTVPRPSAKVGGLIQLGTMQVSTAGLALKPLGWEELTESERELHLRAQRFARVRVAEMRLYDSAAVRHGREIRNVYQVLRSKIDHARKEFAREFLESSPSMADYFHQELVRTLANNDAAAMGGEYPGAMR